MVNKLLVVFIVTHYSVYRRAVPGEGCENDLTRRVGSSEKRTTFPLAWQRRVQEQWWWHTPLPTWRDSTPSASCLEPWLWTSQLESIRVEEKEAFTSIWGDCFLGGVEVEWEGAGPGGREPAWDDSSSSPAGCSVSSPSMLGTGALLIPASSLGGHPSNGSALDLWSQTAWLQAVPDS